jgi:hypothetical protein
VLCAVPAHQVRRCWQGPEELFWLRVATGGRFRPAILNPLSPFLASAGFQVRRQEAHGYLAGGEATYFVTVVACGCDTLVYHTPSGPEGSRTTSFLIRLFPGEYGTKRDKHIGLRQQRVLALIFGSWGQPIPFIRGTQ